MVQCVAAGHEIVGVAHLRPPGPMAQEIGKSKRQHSGPSQGFFNCLFGNSGLYAVDNPANIGWDVLV
jgi:hypothetical protein